MYFQKKLTFDKKVLNLPLHVNIIQIETISFLGN